MTIECPIEFARVGRLKDLNHRFEKGSITVVASDGDCSGTPTHRSWMKQNPLICSIEAMRVNL